MLWPYDFVQLTEKNQACFFPFLLKVHIAEDYFWKNWVPIFLVMYTKNPVLNKYEKYFKFYNIQLVFYTNITYMFKKTFEYIKGRTSKFKGLLAGPLKKKFFLSRLLYPNEYCRSVVCRERKYPSSCLLSEVWVPWIRVEITLIRPSKKTGSDNEPHQ